MERKVWLDWMKAIGMFTIILGHLFPIGLVPFIYSFSVPLFFIVSGFLTNIHLDSKIYFQKIFKGLIIPYTLIWLANVVIYATMAKSIPKDIIERFVGFILGFEMYIGALWFVYTLILLKTIALIYGGGCRNRKPIIQLIFMLLLIFANVSGMYLLNICDHNDLIRPISNIWPSLQIMFQGRIATGWTNVLCAMPFFCFGIFLRESNILNNLVEKLQHLQSSMLILTAVGLLIILYPLAEMNGEMFMYDCGYGKNLLLCYINALIGFSAILLLSISFKSSFKEAIIILTTGSVIVLGFHGIPLNITMLKFKMLTNIGGEIFGKILYALVLYIAFIPVIKSIILYCPILLGNRKK